MTRVLNAVSGRDAHGADGVDRVVIVCPTSEGGHVEHAAAIAYALVELRSTRASLVTRPGSRAYLPRAMTERVDVYEVLPRLPSRGGALGLLWMAANLVREHVSIRRIVRASTAQRTVLLLEEPRYPWPALLSRVGRRVDVKLMVHNAVEHPRTDSGLGERLRRLIAARAVRRTRSRIVHGEEQRTVLAGIGLDSTHVPLPPPLAASAGVSEEVAPPPAAISDQFLCIGELRSNKGVEVALEAARLSHTPLLVVGKAVDERYYRSLLPLVPRDKVVLDNRFLSASEFDGLIRSCRAVVLPYTQFSAQSGVLAHAAGLGVPCLVADLPSLREQAAGMHGIHYFPVGDARALAELMSSLAAMPNRPPVAQPSPAQILRAWSPLVDAVVA